MPKWTPYISGERAVVVGGDYIYCYALTHEESVKFVAAHNADIDALTAERDELQRRLDAVVGSLKPGDQPNYMDPKYNPSKMPPLTEYNLDCMLHGMRKQAHARAVAIAEGREG